METATAIPPPSREESAILGLQPFERERDRSREDSSVLALSPKIKSYCDSSSLSREAVIFSKPRKTKAPGCSPEAFGLRGDGSNHRWPGARRETGTFADAGHYTPFRAGCNPLPFESYRRIAPAW